MKNYYLFIVSEQVNKDGKKVSGREVFDFLMEKKAWGFHPTTQHRSAVKEEDSVIFYLTGLGFVGDADLKSSAYIDKEGSSENWWFNKSKVNYRVDLDNIKVWEKIKPIQPILPSLSFIKKTKNWGAYLQGGVRKITEEDYKVIINSSIYHVDSFKEKTSKEVIDSFDSDSVVYNPHALPGPERVKISRIIENVEKSWQIPNFQRYFDWNKEYIRSFLESVFKDYYVGSFLLWEAAEYPSLEVNPIEGVKDNESKVDYIILDGQQRMTALYYAIKSPDGVEINGSGKKKYFYYLNLRDFIEDSTRENIIVVKDKKLNIEDSFKNLMFPFYELDKFSDWVDSFQDYLEKEIDDQPKIKKICRTIEKRLKHMWDGFEIPYVVLPKTMDLVHVADIFEKINSKGKPLGTFDLLIPRLLKSKIKLKDLWDKASEEYPNLKRYEDETEKVRMAIFQTMSLLYHPGSSCKRKDILNIYESLAISDSSQFESYWQISVESMNEAISRLENMRDGFGVRSEKDISFFSSLPMIAAFLVRVGESDNQALSYEKVKQWYWSSALTRAYSSSVETQMTFDFKEVVKWFDDEDYIPLVVQKARNEIHSYNFLRLEQQSSADYRAILSIFALAGAKDFATNNNLEHARENQKDHIFPKFVYKTHKSVDSVLNMTWLSEKTNKTKKAKIPSEYINFFITEYFGNNEENFITCLSSHLIDKETFDFMAKDDFDSFLNLRQIKIKNELNKRIGGVQNLEARLDSSESEVVDELEIKIRLLIDKKLSFNSSYWEELIPQGIKEKVKLKILQHNQNHPGNLIEDNNLSKLSFCDIVDYSDIIVSNINWGYFKDLFVKKSEVEKHFLSFKEYRNCIKHNRVMNNVIRKSGEASLEWIYSILDLS